jgi:beta-phosphoglucomutase
LKEPGISIILLAFQYIIEEESLLSMLKAIIFDCDGVIADTEPLHLATAKQVLKEEGIFLTDEDYFNEYLALDDRGCFTKAFANHGRAISKEQLVELINRKARYVEPLMQANLKLFSGITDFIERVSTKYPIAIASGARREEIDLILKHGNLEAYFPIIVSTEDVANSKPDPESFLRAWSLLNETASESIEQRECLVIEDSVHGVHAAHSAGMKCLAVTNSYAAELLSEAELIVASLSGLSLEKIESLFEK